MSKDKAEILATHYQCTYELTYRFWVQRNRLFVYMLLTVGLASLLAFNPKDANPIFIDVLAKFLEITDKERKAELQGRFPFAILHGILLLFIFYLSVNLFHRSLYVLRSYAYLADLEDEIRATLDIRDGQSAFSREGKFYWNDRPRMLGTVKYVYVFLLGLLLVAFLAGRMAGDWRSQDRLLLALDFLIGAPILFYFIGYAKTAIRFDVSRTQGKIRN